jgi:hypothetical protein
MPAPSIVSVFALLPIVNALAPGLKKIDSTVAFAESVSEVTFEVRLNVAVSPGLTGAIGGVPLFVQLVGVFQSPEPALATRRHSRVAPGWTSRPARIAPRGARA